jgi:hypothetical protein
MQLGLASIVASTPAPAVHRIDFGPEGPRLSLRISLIIDPP